MVAPQRTVIKNKPDEAKKRLRKQTLSTRRHMQLDEDTCKVNNIIQDVEESKRLVLGNVDPG